MTFGDARLVLIVLALGLGACQDLTPVPPPEAGPDDEASTDDSSTDDSSTDDSSTDDAGDAGAD
jgi:hypothetical protein